MKRLVYLFIFILFPLLVKGQLTAGLTAYWGFDEASGTIVDSVGSNDGTVTGATYNQAGKLNTCFSYDGNDYITTVDGTDLQGYNSDLTIAGWVRPTTITGDDRCIIGGESNAFGLYIQGTTGSLFLRVIDAFTAPISSFSISTGGWYFVAVTVDYSETTNDVMYYSNGSTSTVTFNKDAGFGASSMYIGCEQPSYDHFIGKIDDLMVWKSEISSAQLDSIYNSGIGKIYPFDFSGGSGLESDFIRNGVAQSIYRTSPTVVNKLPLRIPASVEGDFTIYNNIDFEDMTVGICDEDTLDKYFSNAIDIVYHANDYVDILTGTINGGSTKVFAIENDVAFNGFGMELPIDASQTDYDEIYLSYNFRFGQTYSQSTWAKMPGLWADPQDPTVGPSCPASGYGFASHHLFASNYFSSYHYDNTPNANRTNMGGSPADGTCPWAIYPHPLGSVSISNNQWYNLTVRMVMNTFTGGVANPDGIKETWVDGEMISQEDELVYMINEHDTMKIDDLRIGHFKNSETSPDDTAFFDNFIIWMPVNDSISGYELHNTTSTMHTPAKIEYLWWIILLLFSFLNTEQKLLRGRAGQKN